MIVYLYLTMGKHKDLSNFSSTALAQGIGLLCQLLIIKTLTTHLSLSQFGLYSLILIIPALVLPIIFSEITAGLNRFFFEKDKFNLFFNCVIYLCSSFIFFLTLIYFLSPIVKPLMTYFELKVGISTLVLALISHFFIYLNSLTSSFFKINYQPKFLVFQSLILNIPKTIFIFLFVPNAVSKIDLILLIFSVCHALSFLATSFPIIIKSNYKVNFPLIKELLKFSSWLIPGSYFGTIINSSDRILIKVFSNITNVGIYAIGYKIGDLIRQFFIVSFSSVLSPVKFNTTTDKNLFSQRMNNLFYMYTFLGLILAVLINALANPIILIISNSSYLEANYVIPFILFAHLIWGGNDFLNTGYLLKNKTRVTSIILLVGAITNLILNLILIPKYGLIGACLSTAISYAIATPLSYFYSKKYHFLRFKFNYNLLMSFLFFMLSSVQTFINNEHMNLGKICIYNLLIALFFIIISFLLLPKTAKKELNKIRLSII